MMRRYSETNARRKIDYLKCWKRWGKATPEMWAIFSMGRDGISPMRRGVFDCAEELSGSKRHSGEVGPRASFPIHQAAAPISVPRCIARET